MTAKVILKCWLFSLIIGLELFLQVSLLLVLIALCFWVLVLIIITSPLWIPLGICWAPATIISYLALKYTSVRDFSSQVKGWRSSFHSSLEAKLSFALSNIKAEEDLMEDILQFVIMVRSYFKHIGI